MPKLFTFKSERWNSTGTLSKWRFVVVSSPFYFWIAFHTWLLGYGLYLLCTGASGGVFLSVWSLSSLTLYWHGFGGIHSVTILKYMVQVVVDVLDCTGTFRVFLLSHFPALLFCNHVDGRIQIFKWPGGKTCYLESASRDLLGRIINERFVSRCWSNHVDSVCTIRLNKPAGVESECCLAYDPSFRDCNAVHDFELGLLFVSVRHEPDAETGFSDVYLTHTIGTVSRSLFTRCPTGCYYHLLKALLFWKEHPQKGVTLTYARGVGTWFSSCYACHCASIEELFEFVLLQEQRVMTSRLEGCPVTVMVSQSQFAVVESLASVVMSYLQIMQDHRVVADALLSLVVLTLFLRYAFSLTYKLLNWGIKSFYHRYWNRDCCFCKCSQAMRFSHPFTPNMVRHKANEVLYFERRGFHSTIPVRQTLPNKPLSNGRVTGLVDTYLIMKTRVVLTRAKSKTTIVEAFCINGSCSSSSGSPKFFSQAYKFEVEKHKLAQDLFENISNNGLKCAVERVDGRILHALSLQTMMDYISRGYRVQIASLSADIDFKVQ